jgi:TNF receptor-associated factor 4
LCNEQLFTTFLHKKLTREVNALVIHCPQKELGCEWEGELGQLQRHLNPGAGATSTQGCEFLAVECAYRCGAQLQRRLIQEHEMEACPKRPIEMQVASLMKKFEAVVIENRMLKQELDETKKMHQQNLDNLKRALHQQREDLQSHTIPLPVPPFYFCLTNVAHCQSNDLLFCSGPFYSHPGGYKMEVEINSNGCNDTKGAYMGLYVAIVRGEFDDQLRWPFDGRITVQAYNRTTEQWSNEHTITMNKEICTKEVERCMDELVRGASGYAKFLSLSDLKDNYLKGMGAVRFRITSVKVVL